MLLSSFGLRYAVEGALGVTASSADFAAHFYADPVSFFAQARSVSAALGICAIWLVYLLARRSRMSRRASAAAALFMAASPVRMPLFKSRTAFAPPANELYDPACVLAAGVEWIVLSNSVSGRYAGKAEELPKQTAFVEWLKRCWEMRARFMPSDSSPGGNPIWRIERQGPELRVFEMKPALLEKCGERKKWPRVDHFRHSHA